MSASGSALFMSGSYKERQYVCAGQVVCRCKAIAACSGMYHIPGGPRIVPSIPDSTTAPAPADPVFRHGCISVPQP